MFVPGDIVLAPWRGDDGKEVGDHYLVVLGWSSGLGLIGVYTTSLKEREGGMYAFSTQEREQADFGRPCRFDPNRVALYPPELVLSGVIRPTRGRLSRKSMQRIEAAVRRARPELRKY